MIASSPAHYKFIRLHMTNSESNNTRTARPICDSYTCLASVGPYQLKCCAFPVTNYVRCAAAAAAAAWMADTLRWIGAGGKTTSRCTSTRAARAFLLKVKTWVIARASFHASFHNYLPMISLKLSIVCAIFSDVERFDAIQLTRLLMSSMMEQCSVGYSVYSWRCRQAQVA